MHKMLSPFVFAFRCVFLLKHDNLVPPASTLGSHHAIGHSIGTSEATQEQLDNVAIGCVRLSVRFNGSRGWLTSVGEIDKGRFDVAIFPKK